MRRLIPFILTCLAFGLGVGAATAQVVLTPQTVAYGIKPLAGETVEFHCTETGGSTNLVNWSILNQNGGATATMVNSANAPCTNRVTIGSTQGTLTLNGTAPTIYANVTSGTGQTVTTATISNGGAGLPISSTFPIIFSDNNGNEALANATTNVSGVIASIAFVSTTTNWVSCPNQNFSDNATGGTVTISCTVTSGSVTSVAVVTQSGTWGSGYTAQLLRDSSGNVALVSFTLSGGSTGTITAVNLVSSTGGWNTSSCFGSGSSCAINTFYEAPSPYTITSPTNFLLQAQSPESSYDYTAIQAYGTGSGGGSGTAAPTIAGNMSICGESCSGGSSTGSYTFAFGTASPSLSGGSMALTTTGQNYNTQAFTTAVNCALMVGGNCSSVTDILAQASLYVPSSTSTPETLEGPNAVMYTGTYQLYPSWQCDASTGDWRYWNGALGGGTWVSVGVACPIRTQTNVWHTLQAHYVLNQSGNSYTYLELDVDGIAVWTGSITVSGISFSSSAALKAQVQIGGALSGTPSTTIYYDNWNIVTSLNSTSVAQWPVHIAANTTACSINPFYKVLYAAQTWETQVHCDGTTSPFANWSITSSPSGGNGVLHSPTGSLTNVGLVAFSATVAGRYTVQACNNPETTKCGTMIYYVTGNALPYAVTPKETQPVDPTIDPAMTGTDYEVGPGKAYANLTLIPQSIGAGSTIRLWNEDSGCSSPTTYNNIFYLTDTSSTSTQPIRIVGVPDACGDPPIITGVNAIAASWINNYDETQALGLVYIGQQSSGGCPSWCYVTNPKGVGPYNIIFEGIEVENAHTPYTFSSPGTTDNCCSWGVGSGGVNVQTGYNLVVASNSFHNDSICFFSRDNSNNNYWGAITQNIDNQGNEFDNCGDNGVEETHANYVQTLNAHISSNVVNGFVTGGEGADIKTRSWGTEFITSNYEGCQGSPERAEDKVDREDSGNYTTWFGFLGGVYGLGIGQYANLWNQYQASLYGVYAYGFSASNVVTAGEVIPMDFLAGLMASSRISVSTGNIQCLSSNHYSGDHQGGDNNRVGDNIVSFQTTTSGGFMFNFLGAGLGSDYNPEIPGLNLQNSIFWGSPPAPVPGVSGPGFMITDMQSPWFTFGTDLVPGSGYVNTTPPILGVDYHTADGWANGEPANDYQLSNTITPRITGIGNFVTTSTIPFNATSYVPSGAALGAAVALTGLAAGEPPIYWMNPVTGQRTIRTSYADLGAVQGSGASITVPRIRSGTTARSGSTR